MKIRGIINLLVMLLWFVASHHCAFESFADHSHKQSSSHSHSSTNSEDATSSDCPSHPTGDPASHQEGTFCGISAQVASSMEFSHAISKQSIVLNIFIAFSSRFFDDVSSADAASVTSLGEPSSTVLSRLAHSLSSAANAPPVTLA